jgi:WhiB family redox-sensing transcriptional regulator
MSVIRRVLRSGSPVPPSLIGDEEWGDRAECRRRGIDTELFFEYTSKEDVMRLREVCNSCPVRNECLADALAIPERFGFRGGMLPKEREDLRRVTGVQYHRPKREAYRDTSGQLGA